MAAMTPNVDIIETVAPGIRKGRGRPAMTETEAKQWSEYKKSPQYVLDRKQKTLQYMKKYGEKALAEKKYQCPLCQKCYSTAAGLKYHTVV